MDEVQVYLILTGNIIYWGRFNIWFDHKLSTVINKLFTPIMYCDITKGSFMVWNDDRDPYSSISV